MQWAYEDRIGALRAQIDATSSREMRDQDALRSRLAEMASRQAQLEARAGQISALAAKIDPAETVIAGRRDAFAPVPAKATVAVEKLKPTPEGFELRGARLLGDDPPEAVDPATPQKRLRDLSRNFDRIERAQIAALDNLRAPMAARAERLRQAFDEAGLPVERMMRRAASPNAEKSAAIGGPFEPAAVGGGAFESAYASVSQSLASIDGLRRALAYAPLRQPLPGALDVTSGFGFRADPFFGRPALHTGVDLRGDIGDPVRATAAGRVTVAGATGGYGNLVEIDHGAGLATRYGHLSQIEVDEGQWIEAGALIGEIGSTGRSTGPHLHYELRVDGAAVDPARALRAARILNFAL
jgi:murein DD-endopeptidase MepM/ murein hydrolase activator NlpD